jgi:hypothetical protein
VLWHAHCVGAGAEDPRLLAALVDELMRKSGLCWVRPDGSEREHPVWHVWRDGAGYVVSGGAEQPLPGIESAAGAIVVVRTKDTRQRLLAWRADVSTVAPGDAEWHDVVGALVAARLNLADPDEAARRWREECVVSRLAPSGEVTQTPDAMPADELAAPPQPTPAVTRKGLPRVLHRRQTRRPDLR